MGYDVFGTHISPKTLMSLLFGSQGTLGIITEMTLRLAGEAHQSSGFAIEFTTLDDLSPLLTRGTFANAAYVLLFDRKTLMYQESLGETKLSRHTSAAYVLCAIYEGEETAIKRDVNQAIKATNLPKERITHIMKEEVPLYETLYKKQADALMAYAGNIQTAYRILNDIMLPREHLGNGIRELATLVEEYGLLYSITADCMQGVVRLEVLLDQSKSNLGSTIIELLTGAAEIVKHYRGSLAYKEGDGLMLTPLLPFIYGAPLAETMRSIKNIWDKDHIFNTGKKTTIDFSYLTSHIRHSP
jgi:FAD/FMN-containing dehydrogenase